MQLSPEQQKAIEEQKQNCIFCKIIKGDVPSKKVFDDSLFISILDINPARKGHMLFMPKEHYPISPLIPPETFKKMAVMIKEMAKVCHEGLVSLGSTIFIANGAAAGQQSQHFMLHIIPRDENDGLSCFEIPKNKIAKEETEKIYPDLKKNLGMMMHNHLARMGKAPPPKEVLEEQLIGIIEMNKPLLDMVLHKPDQFKQMAMSHPQLAPMFKNKNIDAIIEKIKKKHGKEEIKEAEIVEEKKEKEEKKETEEKDVKEELTKEDEESSDEEKKNEENKEDKTSLDDISKLFK